MPAFPTALSLGREYPTEADPDRDDFQRDRDRIVHSRAFRRLQYKTQVFANAEGDHFRTRLTHTIEVANLARSCARALHLNEDLAECIALVHDLGHPPFGHRGEDMLNVLMAEHGGFEHNRQALRIVELLDVRYPEHAGLNLTYEVREGIVKHGARFDPSRIPERFRPQDAPLLEACLVDELDAVAYDCHDIDDGLRSGLLSLEQLAEVPLWAGAWREAVDASPRQTSPRLIAERALRRLMNAMVDDCLKVSRQRIERCALTTIADVRACHQQVIGFSLSMRQAKESLEAWLFTNLYRHWQINQTFHTARAVIEALFQFFIAHADALPPDHAQRIASDGHPRVVADYLAGMTDRFALDEHRRLCR